MTEIPSLAEAAARGRQAAREHDARLRERESEERAARLAESGPPPAAGQEVLAAVDLFRMRSELEALQRYRQAVEGSRVWRLAQLLRRMVGRAW